MNKNSNSRKGFTLVEVIVVAVIVLILSAVAIPLYNGFIRDARQDAAQSLAETAAAAANTHWRRTGANPASPILPDTPPLRVSFDGGTGGRYTVTIVNNSNIQVVDNRHSITASATFRTP